MSIDTEAATNRQPVDGGEGDNAQLARARDGQRTSSRNTLPDTDRYQQAVSDWWDRVRDVLYSLRDGSFWDEQPPSPRELVQRCQESPWLRSEYGALKILRKLGCGLSILWSVPLYALAILGQRFGRVVIAIPTIYLLFHLI